MHTLTIKIPPALEQDIARASAREHLSKSELVRRALTAYLRHGDCAHRLLRSTARAIWWAALVAAQPIWRPTPPTWPTLAKYDAPCDP